MKDEIKEILEEFESLFEISEAPEHIINDFKKIKDCITNLQEENEKVHKDFAELSERYFFTKSRNEKAIEYIIKNCDVIRIDNGYIIQNELTTYGLGELLKILQGSDKE